MHRHLNNNTPVNTEVLWGGGGYGQGPQPMTGTEGVAPAIAPARARGAPTCAIVCNSVQDQGAFSCSLDSTQLGTQCDVVQSSTTQCVKAGEGDRTLDIQLGKRKPPSDKW
jgi:hypothetical protein